MLSLYIHLDKLVLEPIDAFQYFVDLDKCEILIIAVR